MILLKLSLLLIVFGCIGWLARPSLSPNRINIEQSFFDLLSGLGILSLLYFALASAGGFRGRYIAGATVLLAMILAMLRNKYYGRTVPAVKEIALLASTCLGVALLAVLMFRYAPPYEAILGGDDASIYSAAAAQLAHTGSLSYHDSLVQEMTAEQKEAIFRNRFREDWTGPYVRFAGGVRLTQPETGTVQFAFYHLTNVWLAFAIKAFGLIHYSIWLSLISALTICVLFFLGKRIGGTPAGIALPLMMFLFYPHQYFSRFPVSEPFAQFFFLAGLLSLIQVLQDSPQPEAAELRRTGILWGASFFARVDCIYLVTMFLVICLIAVPSFVRDRKRWLPMLRILAVSMLGAICYQFATGEYISLFTNSENLQANAATDFALHVVTTASNWIQSHPELSIALFIAVAGIVLALPIRFKTSRRLPPFAAGALAVAMTVFLLVPITGFPPQRTFFLRHLHWFLPYAPAILWILLAAGALFVGLREFKKPAVQVCLIFFALACAVYLLRPLIIPAQPWSMRRFVPVLVPMFFLLAVCGWSLAAAMLPNKYLRGVAFYSAAAVCLFLLYSKSAYLFREPLYRGILAQCDALAGKIPPGALLLVPDEIAGQHFELVLRYRNNIDALLLPLDDVSGRRMNQAVWNYVEQQMIQRPVVVLSSQGPSLLHQLWRKSWPRKIANDRISIVVVPRVDRYEYPARVQTVEWDVSLYQLSTSKPPLKFLQSISYDDPSVTFLNFHEIESGFRWTHNQSTVTDFSFPTQGKPVEISIALGPIPPGMEIKPMVKVNYVTPATFAKYEDNTLFYLLKPGAVDEITSVTIESPAFQEPGVAQPRELGISFVRLGFGFPTSSSD